MMISCLHDVIVVQRKSNDQRIILSNTKESYVVYANAASEQFRVWIFKLFGGEMASKILNPSNYRDLDGNQMRLSAYNEKGPKNLEKKLKKIGCKFYTV